MKKFFILALLICCCTVFSYGQHFRGGFQAGVLHSRLAGGDEKVWGTGFLFGAHVSYDIFRMEINYIRKGGTSVVYNNNIGWFDKYNVGADYVQVPLSVTFSTEDKEDEGTQYFFECGIAPARLLDSFSKINYVTFRTGYQYRKFTTDIFAGAGLNFGDVMYLGLRYSWSLFPDVKRNSVPRGFFWQTFGNGHNITHQVVLRFSFGQK